MAAMTKEQLSERIDSAISGMIKDFLSQPSPESIQAEKDFKALEEQKQAARALGEDSAAYKAAAKEIEKQQKALDQSDAKGQQTNRRQAAWAVVHVCNTLRVPVALKKAAPVSGGNGAPAETRSRGRRPKEQIEQERAAILGAMSKKRQSPQEIAEKADLDLDSVRSDLDAMVTAKLVKKIKGKKGVAGSAGYSLK